MSKNRILIFVVAYNAEKTLDWVLDRIPRELLVPGNSVLVIDDSSSDKTYEVGLRYQEVKPGIDLVVLRTPVNQGYGGNQKLGYRYAIEKGFEAVVLVHGDGQYPPEMIDEITAPIFTGEAEAVFGSRMLTKGAALEGGMPLYKYVGNKVLTRFQNLLLGTELSEFHSGFRAYSVKALSEVPFESNTNDFHFDTEIIIQFFRKGFRISEIPIRTHYGEEICHVNGFRYAWDVVKATTLSRVQSLGLFYQRKFDVGKARASKPYESKVGFRSSHQLALDAVEDAERVLDLGCGEGIVGRELKKRGCRLASVDREPEQPVRAFSDEVAAVDLDDPDLREKLPEGPYDTVLLLDILENIKRPEEFLDALRLRYGVTHPRVILTTGNVTFFLLRLALLFGQFNYGPRGILDKDHKRLFSFQSLSRLLEESGYQVRRIQGIPAPFPLALGDSDLSHFLLSINSFFIRISRSLFSYQIFIEAEMTPDVKVMLEDMLQPGSANEQ